MSEYQVGFSRQEITSWEPDMQIWGWFVPGNRIDGVATPLYVRAMVVRQQEQAVAYVCMDLGYVSIALREIVLDILQQDHPSLGLGPHNVMFTATHTHAGPCGFSDVIAQTSASYGFSPVVLTKVAEGTVAAILDASRKCAPATIRVASVEIPLDEKIAFNRSVRSYLRNKDVHRISHSSPEQATRRTSTTLRVDNAKGQFIGLVNWFGVHATCVHAENTKLHSDNKGLAAFGLEQQIREATDNPDFVAIFAQDAAGDVSPNFRYSAARDKVIGISDDDYESAQHNANIHIHYAQVGAEKALQSPLISGDIGGRTRHVDMANVKVLPRFANNQSGCKTTYATWGMLMPTGTAEGPGPMKPLLPVLRQWMRWRRLRQRLPLPLKKQEVKAPFLELGLGTDGRFMKLIPTHRGLGIIGKFDPVIGYVHAVYKDGTLGPESWLPQHLPVQLLRIGAVAIFGMAGEPTTTSGARLRKILAQTLRKEMVSEIIINGYSNGYAGYIATPEEYEQQEYEGSYTIFGRWTLGAYQAIAEDLAKQSIAPEPFTAVEGPALPIHSYDTLMRRREAGRKGVWGPGSEPGVPEPASPFLQRMKQAMQRG